MLQFLAETLSGPTRRRLGKHVKCVVCRSPRIRYVWLWGTDVAVTLCDDQSRRHLAVKRAETRHPDFDFLADVSMTLGKLNDEAAARKAQP